MAAIVICCDAEFGRNPPTPPLSSGGDISRFQQLQGLHYLGDSESIATSYPASCGLLSALGLDIDDKSSPSPCGHKSRACGARPCASPFCPQHALTSTQPCICILNAFALSLFASDAPISGLSWRQHLEPGATADRYLCYRPWPGLFLGFSLS